MYGWQKWIDLPGFLISNFKLHNYDLIHLQGYPYWERVYSPNNPHSVYTVDNLYHPRDFPQGWEDTLKYLTKNMVDVCKKSSKVITIAKWLQSDMYERFGIDSECITNGVDINEIDKGNEEDFRKIFNIEEEFYLFVGRATKYKRPDLFVSLAESIPHRSFVMIGRGLTREGLTEYIGKIPPKNLICLGEPERKHVVNAFLASKVFVLPSSNETFGIVLIEGMAARKPVIGANHLGPKEIITPGENGFLFEPGNLEDLVKKANLAWDAKDVGLAGRLEVEERYDWKKIIEKIDQIYERCVNRPC